MKQSSDFPRSSSTPEMIDALRQVDSQFSLHSMYHWPGLRVIFRHRAPAKDFPEFHDVLQGAHGRILFVLGALEGPEFESEIVRLELLALIRGIGATAKSAARVARLVREPLERLNRGRVTGVYCHFFCGLVDRAYTQMAYCQAGNAAWLSLVSPKGVFRSKPTGDKLGLLTNGELGESVVALSGVERLILGTGRDEAAGPGTKSAFGDWATDVWRDPPPTLESSLVTGGFRSDVAKSTDWRAVQTANAQVMVELSRSTAGEWGPFACEQVRKCQESSDLSLDPCVFLG